MYSLLLDSSNTCLTVGLDKDKTLVDFVNYECWQKQSEHMIPEIDALLKKYSIDRKDISSIVVGIGPGSYTGVRIAVSIAKVISLALEIPIYPVSSLRILKDDDKPSICLINARSGRSYFAVYKGQDTIISDTIKTNEQVLDYINEYPDYVICGNAKYLGFEGFSTNICHQMIDLMDAVEPLKDTLGLKPVYMKD